MSIIIETSQLSKWFGEVVALNNINMTIEKGVTGLLGPNGAGKSTFIKLALGLYRPSRGTIKVMGGPPRNNLHVLRNIGYCPETDKFYDNMTGYEFVYYLSRSWGMSSMTARKVTEEVCEWVQMSERMHDPIDQYSKGMRQRIKIAQSLVGRPDLLFLDEPMAGLDPKGREEMFSLIRRLGDEGLSVMLSSHILYEIERVTDQVALLYKGALLAHGRIREIRDLIDQHPHTIRVNSSDPRSLSKCFLDDPGVRNISFEPGKLVLHTQDPNACYQKLNTFYLNKDKLVDGIECADDNLQAVFEYLTK